MMLSAPGGRMGMKEMTLQPTEPNGAQVISWVTMLAEIAPSDDWTDLWHDDADARELHRLRGLALSQASETENVIAQVLGILDPASRRDRPIGALLKSVEASLSDVLHQQVAGLLQQLTDAITRRNRLAHDSIQIGSAWHDEQYVPVIALLGAEEVTEDSMLHELALQQSATRAAVMLLIAIDTWERGKIT